MDDEEVSSPFFQKAKHSAIARSIWVGNNFNFVAGDRGVIVIIAVSFFGNCWMDNDDDCLMMS